MALEYISIRLVFFALRELRACQKQEGQEGAHREDIEEKRLSKMLFSCHSFRMSAPLLPKCSQCSCAFVCKRWRVASGRPPRSRFSVQTRVVRSRSRRTFVVQFHCNRAYSGRYERWAASKFVHTHGAERNSPLAQRPYKLFTVAPPARVHRRMSEKLRFLSKLLVVVYICVKVRFPL